MPANIRDLLNNTKEIFMTDSAVSTLLDFERVLDELDLYAFEHWKQGELVEGPTISKYWVKCKFMWPYNLMPDPSGAKRLIPYGAKITYQKDVVRMPIKINSPGDYRDGSKKGKLVETPVWYVDIMMPKNLLSEIKQGSIEIAGEDIDLSELQTAYEKDFDQKALTMSNTTQAGAATQTAGAGAEAMPQPGAANAPPAF